MQAPLDSSFQDLFTHVIGDMAKAIAERQGESEQQRAARVNAAIRMILSFFPRDAIEAMLAGHCAMFHELLTDCMGKTLRGEMETLRRGHANLLGMNRAFLNTLDRLTRCQRRAAEGGRDAPRDEVRPSAPPAAPPSEAPAQERRERESAGGISVPKAGIATAPFRPSPPSTLTSTTAALEVLRAGDKFDLLSGHGQAPGVTATTAGGAFRRPSS